jgi:hypothetical protein
MRLLPTVVIGAVLTASSPFVVHATDCSLPPGWTPVLVSGLFCGEVIRPDGTRASGVWLDLLDGEGKIKATAFGDVRGRFTFSGMPGGIYTVNAPVWGSVDQIQISDVPSPTCAKQFVLHLPPVPILPCFSGIQRPLEESSSVVRGSGLPRQSRTNQGRTKH